MISFAGVKYKTCEDNGAKKIISIRKLMKPIMILLFETIMIIIVRVLVLK